MCRRGLTLGLRDCRAAVYRNYCCLMSRFALTETIQNFCALSGYNTIDQRLGGS